MASSKTCVKWQSQKIKNSPTNVTDIYNKSCRTPRTLRACHVARIDLGRGDIPPWYEVDCHKTYKVSHYKGKEANPKGAPKSWKLKTTEEYHRKAASLTKAKQLSEGFPNKK